MTIIKLTAEQLNEKIKNGVMEEVQKISTTLLEMRINDSNDKIYVRIIE